MPEDISLQILSQTSENIQKLFDLSTRIDERVKAIQSKQDDLDDRMSEVVKAHTDILQKVAVLQSKESGTGALSAKLDECQKEVHQELLELDKRLAVVEGKTNTSQDRWNKIFAFAIQIIWVILAAYLLMKLGIQAPVVP
jgi:phage-related minor tail protein